MAEELLEAVLALAADRRRCVQVEASDPCLGDLLDGAGRGSLEPSGARRSTLAVAGHGRGVGGVTMRSVASAEASPAPVQAGSPEIGFNDLGDLAGRIGGCGGGGATAAPLEAPEASQKELTPRLLRHRVLRPTSATPIGPRSPLPSPSAPTLQIGSVLHPSARRPRWTRADLDSSAEIGVVELECGGFHCTMPSSPASWWTWAMMCEVSMDDTAPPPEASPCDTLRVMSIRP